MTNNQLTCPVCALAVSGQEVAYCPACGWELFVVASSANKALSDYYQNRLEQYKTLYEELKLTKSTVEEQRLLHEVEMAQLKNSLLDYERLLGHSWVPSNGAQSPAEVIQWELLSPLKLRLTADKLQQLLPERLVLLLKKDSRPLANGDFDYALTVSTQQVRFVKDSAGELILPADRQLAGRYFLRLMTVQTTTSNLLFFHKDQAEQPTFDWNKTLIQL